ncbi:MAG: Ribonuclease BN [Candidatus Erwinia impunctatus]
MELLFLGTGAGTPSRQRNVTSIAVNFQSHHPVSWLFDCGEGTQQQILRSPVKLGKIEKIFITHLHGDHIFGLPGFLTSRSMIGNTTPLTLFGPAGLKEYVDVNIRLSGSWISFPLEIIEISAGEIYRDDYVSVIAQPLTHPVPCFGYRITERDKPGALDVQTLLAEGIEPGRQFQALKEGKTVTLEDGRIINGWDYLGPATPGLTVAIFGDTAPTPCAQALASQVDVMVHEATLEAAMQEKANARGHSTTVQAAETAKTAGAKKLIITHISSRYTREEGERLLDECRAIFPDTDLAHDFSLFSL